MKHEQRLNEQSDSNDNRKHELKLQNSGIFEVVDAIAQRNESGQPETIAGIGPRMDD